MYSTLHIGNRSRKCFNI